MGSMKYNRSAVILFNPQRGADLTRQNNPTTSTICTILENQDEIIPATPAKGVSRLSEQHSSVQEEMEKFNFLWINATKLARGFP